jgi:hypothetical protein
MKTYTVTKLDEFCQLTRSDLDYKTLKEAKNACLLDATVAANYLSRDEFWADKDVKIASELKVKPLSTGLASCFRTLFIQIAKSTYRRYAIHQTH